MHLLPWLNKINITSSDDKISKFFAKHIFAVYEKMSNCISIEIYIFQLCLFVDIYDNNDVKINVVYKPG